MPRIIRRIAGKRADWLVNLRWIACACVIIATFISSEFFHFSIRSTELYFLAIVLLILNIIYKILVNKIRKKKYEHLTERKILVFQIITDLALLTCLLHFSGGVENPFIIYYIFHQMIASILLPKKTAYLIATYSLFLVALLAFLEYFSIIPHYTLDGFLKYGFYNHLSYLVGTGFVFVTTSYFVVYLTSTISAQLRDTENSYRLANIQLEEKDKVKDEYVYRLSHDIKGHIAAIKGCLDASSILMDPVKIKEFDTKALNRTELLTEFLKNLLRITRLRLNKESELTNFSLKNVIEEVIGLNRDYALSKEISFHLEIDDNENLYTGNRFSITEAITNLVVNAIKYSNRGGEVLISLRFEKDHFIFEIEDHGIGIPEEDKGNIFIEFFRARNAVKLNSEGDGLGLAIVKQIVENHKGKITLKSKENKGTKFIVKLPVNLNQ